MPRVASLRVNWDGLLVYGTQPGADDPVDGFRLGVSHGRPERAGGDGVGEAVGLAALAVVLAGDGRAVGEHLPAGRFLDTTVTETVYRR